MEVYWQRRVEGGSLMLRRVETGWMEGCGAEGVMHVGYKCTAVSCCSHPECSCTGAAVRCGYYGMGCGVRVCMRARVYACVAETLRKA